jgi:uncharacterized protein (TIGR00106 family)
MLPSGALGRPVLAGKLGCLEVRQVSVLVAFSVTPMGVGEGVGEIVAEAVKVVRDSGLPNTTDSMFTVIEGDTWAEVMTVVQRAVETVAARAPRVSTVIKADWRHSAADAMSQKVDSVERRLAGPASPGV